MKIYLNKTVFAEALDRIRFIFDEFENVTVAVSGGKDSTVVFNLAMIVARERGRLPLRVMWIDQEAEWQGTADMVRSIMYDTDVLPRWYQMPIRLFNATSTIEHWLNCWEEGKDWVREKDPLAITENVYSTDRFHELFTAIAKTEFPDSPTVQIAGVRTEESPTRFVGLTSMPTYKGVTWGKILDRKRGHYSLYPIYDWSYMDVWKAIHAEGWQYNRIYDEMYRYGYSVSQMRVSNLHHETAVQHLFFLQEIEPETYNKVTARIQGIDTAGKLGKADYFVHDLPFMFKSWKEYRDFLLEKLITDPDWKKRFVSRFKKMDEDYAELRDITALHKEQVQSILANDWEGIKLDNWKRMPEVNVFRKWKRGDEIHALDNTDPGLKQYNRHIPLSV